MISVHEWLPLVHAVSLAAQYAAVVTSLVGCALTVYGARDAMETRRIMVTNHINSYRLSGVAMVLWTHAGIGTVQALLVVTSVLALTVMPMPPGMYGVQGGWVVAVLTVANLIHVLASLVLLAISVYKMYWLSTVPSY